MKSGYRACRRTKFLYKFRARGQASRASTFRGSRIFRDFCARNCAPQAGPSSRYAKTRQRDEFLRKLARKGLFGLLTLPESFKLNKVTFKLFYFYFRGARGGSQKRASLDGIQPYPGLSLKKETKNGQNDQFLDKKVDASRPRPTGAQFT